eukprot:1381714-Amphidinium_carterae.1
MIVVDIGICFCYVLNQLVVVYNIFHFGVVAIGVDVYLSGFCGFGGRVRVEPIMLIDPLLPKLACRPIVSECFLIFAVSKYLIIKLEGPNCCVRHLAEELSL